MSSKLTSPYQLGKITLSNRVVMAPMTRSRAVGNLANELIANYYAQRASAGLIITEGVSPSPNGLGYARIPGISTSEQTDSWKQVTDAVHKKDGKIFIQLMHTGRIGHPLNLPEGGRVVAPSSIKAAGQMWTDQEGMKDHPIPQEMSSADIVKAKNEFVQAALNAVEAGFDGVELHGANGYLLEQFLSPFSNQRTDAYGGTLENRSRFVLEVAQEVTNAIGSEKVGIRLSPFGVFNDMPLYDEIEATYNFLAKELGKIGIAYIHIVDHSGQGAPEVPAAVKSSIRAAFPNTIILSGGYDAVRAEADLLANAGDLIAFGRPFIANPDLVLRIRENHELNLNLDGSTLYTPGDKGYTDYPVYAEQAVGV